MISFDSLTLNKWLKENSEFLTGARIQKIQQPTRRDFIFSIRKSGETKKLYLNINPQYYHVCFMSKGNEEKRLIEIPSKPPMFCMLLRKYLENSVICKVNQPKYERILELYIETFNEISEKIYLCLAIELMGKHSNIILYNYDTNIRDEDVLNLTLDEAVYILTQLNILLFAGLLQKRGKADQVSEYVSDAIAPDELNVYAVQNDGTVVSIIDPETNMISQNYLDSVSEELSIKFQQLYRLLF